MKKSIFLAIILAIFVSFMAGCGGGAGAKGGSTGGGTDEPPVACTDTEWTPAIPETAVVGQSFTQTKCDSTRVIVIGEKWINRADTSEAALFKALTGTMEGAVMETNANGGLTLLGQNSSSKNNKGLLYDLASDGTMTQLVSIDSPLNTTFVAEGIASDSSHIVVSYKRIDNQGGIGFNRQGFTTSGAFFFGENNAGYNLEKMLSFLEGNKLFTSRIAPATPPPAPYPYSATQLMYQDLVSSGLDIAVDPAIAPQMVSADSTGIYVSDGVKYMEYDRSFNVLKAPTSWSSSTNAVIHDVKSYGDKTYIAGSEDGILKITVPGNDAFKFIAIVPVGTDKVRLGFDASGNMYVSVGNRIGLVDKATGKLVTTNPVAVPANSPWKVSGSNIYFLENGSTIYRLPLSTIPSN